MKPSKTVESLSAHQSELQDTRMSALFENDPDRFERFSLRDCGLLFDYSKQLITPRSMELLFALAKECEVSDWIERLFRGDKVNHTEGRAALHMALRSPPTPPVLVDGVDVMPEVHAVLKDMRRISDEIRHGEWTGFTGRPIETIVNIGIGGSDLGPLMVSRALRDLQHSRLQARFVSNIDPSQISAALADLDPETTLFIVVSKTFTTQETLTNAMVARDWLVQALGSDSAVASHFVAISTALDKVADFGIDARNTLGFWDWVGGRYSLWSAVGLSIAVLAGMDAFEELLAGAHAMDEHFRTAPLEQNMPVIMGLLGVWNGNFWLADTHAVLPYDLRLEYLPAYLQQLEMESNGKHVDRNGQLVSYTTGAVIWGAPGNNGQHAFYQLLHQGTKLIPSDIIVSVNNPHGDRTQQDKLLANALGQAQALMLGRDESTVADELFAAGLSDEELALAVPFRLQEGNQPTTMIVYDDLTPAILGALIALYEHRVFVESVCWNINPFDQFGVELGKQMAATLLPAISTGGNESFDASTNGLLDEVIRLRK